MDRLQEVFARCRAEERPAVVIYVTGGCPELETGEAVARAAFDGGAAVLELGVPFSDPTADGPVIQRAAQQALRSGIKLRELLAQAGRLRRDYPDRGLILFSYYNVLLNYGLEQFACDAAANGVDGVLVVDLPDEEKAELTPHLKRHGLRWITLVAPATPPERVARLVREAEGFVYCVTVSGVTGERREFPAGLAEKLRQVRGLSPVPVVAGFGVSTPEQVAELGAQVDGVVIGSAVMKVVEKAGENAPAAVRAFVETLTARYITGATTRNRKDE